MGGLQDRGLDSLEQDCEQDEFSEWERLHHLQYKAERVEQH